MESAINLPSLLIPIYRDGDERVLSITKFLARRAPDGEEKKTISVKGLVGSSLSFIIRAVAEKKPGVHLVIPHDKEQAAYILNDLETLTSPRTPLPLGEGNKRGEVLFFPSSFKKPFSAEDIDTSSIQLRAEVLNEINSPSAFRTSSLIIVSYPDAVAEKVISKEHLEKNSIHLNKGEKISLSFLTDLLDEYGFQRCDYVLEPGQFSVRGGIVDIFSFANDDPFRIELSGDEVESIRSFDTVNQLSVKNFDSASILPNIQEKLSEGKSESIIEYILKSKNELYVWAEDFIHILPSTEEELVNIPVTAGEEKPELFLSSKELKKDFSKASLIEFGNMPSSAGSEEKSSVKFNFVPQPSFNKNFTLLETNLKYNSENGFRNFIFCDSAKQSERLYAIFESLGGEGKTLKFTPLLSSIHEGFTDNDNKISCYTDHQIFGRYHRYKIKSSGFKKNEALTLKMLKSLQPGDFITHIDYGIGRFGGLEKIDVNGKQQEAIRLVYRDNDTLYISIHSLHQISKYGGKESELPKLDKLGSNAWTSLKARTKKKIKELAFDLVKLYAERKKQKGFAFSPDNYLQNELEASFIYEDTPDQLKSTFDVKSDMEEESPMDRLICGDVGFGKTEIAIRASFKAACDSKQTAILVPTTILALQHFKTFSDRMKGLPVTIDYINRFKSSKDQKESLKKLSEGKTDIIIGTHRLLGKDVKFKDLGLLIVDEEQKFGVGAKDKLKLLRANVDTLTLTATPIPRTLQFSMMGARDMSVINTPPPNRYPVLTEVHLFNEKTIQDAIEYELQRNGQIFFVHNRVQTIARYAELIQKLCPKAKTLVAHGQLRGEALEKAMMNFIEGEYDVLVCTTIIESGLDIPNVNTIIINDAQNYGLSDLYQLRGRVGRSNKKAFCYLLTPPYSTLTNEAKKRLRAIEEFSELGSGINVAMRDLDIRGAGNLLGAEQSGFITEIGYEMYQKILDEAMAELRNDLSLTLSEGEGTERATLSPSGRVGEGWRVCDCVIDTDLSVLIPDEYVENITERIALYQQLDSSKTEDDLILFEKQLLDRFGKIPEETKKLITIVRLRWLSMELGFEKLVLKNGKLTAWFVSNQKSPYFQSEIFSKVLQFVQSNTKICTMNEGESKLILKIGNIKDVDKAMEILNFIKQNLKVE